jgi:hypothetical protein
MSPVVREALRFLIVLGAGVVLGTLILMAGSQ